MFPVSIWSEIRHLTTHLFSPYLKEAAAPVCEATGGFLGWCSGGHVVQASGSLSRLGQCPPGRELCGSKTRFSCGATRGNSCFDHSQYYRGAGLSVCLLFQLSDSPSSQILASIIFVCGLNSCPLITCLPCFLTVSDHHALHSYILFPCPHTYIINFPSRTASVPAQLLCFPARHKVLGAALQRLHAKL